MRRKAIVANYYRILEIPKTATSEQIREAYRKQCIRWHPDRNPGDKKAEEKFKRVAEAYGILIDESSRAAYNKSLRESKEATARATEEPQQQHAHPRSQTEILFMIAQVVKRSHEKGRSWLEILNQLQEDGLSQEGAFSVLALCCRVLKTSIPYEEMVEIAWMLHKQGVKWGTIADLTQEAGYSEKLAYKVLKDIAARERKQDRILSRGSVGINLLDAFIRGLSSTGPRRSFSTKRNHSQSDSGYTRRSWSRYY